jgi:hypothetical protein
VLSSAGDLVRLAEPGDVGDDDPGDLDPVGPQLWFGGGARQMVALVPNPHCEEQSKVPFVIEGRGRPAESVCRDGVQIAVTGAEWFREAALKGIRVTLKD